LGQVELGYAKAQTKAYGNVPGLSKGNHMLNQIWFRSRKLPLKERAQGIIILRRGHLFLKNPVYFFDPLD